jgi:organic radical activating enzyme
LPVPRSIDWICVSPKPNSDLVQRSGDELKLVYPHEVLPESVAGLDFAHFFLQPMDGPQRAANTAATVDYCRAHPQWRLSLQTHKLLGIP